MRQTKRVEDDFQDKPQTRIDVIVSRLSLLEAKTTAAHQRMDKLDTAVRDDLRDLKSSLKEMSQELKDVMAWMNRGKGWAAASLLVIGLMGGTIVSLIVNKWIG